MAKREKENSHVSKRTKSGDIEYEIERSRLEKWRLGRRNFP